MGRSPLRAKGNVVVAIPLVALVVAAVLFGVAMAQDREAQGRVLHTVEVEHQVAQVRALALEAETGARGYLLTGQTTTSNPTSSLAVSCRARWPVWGA
jgi:CHASE3 domain sensor protein